MNKYKKYLLAFIIICSLPFLGFFLYLQIMGAAMEQKLSVERYDCECKIKELLNKAELYKNNKSSFFTHKYNNNVPENNPSYVFQIENDIYASFYLSTNEPLIVLSTIFNNDFENEIDKNNPKYTYYRNQFEEIFINKLGIKCTRR